MKKNIFLILFSLFFIKSFAQSDTILILMGHNSLGGRLIDTNHHVSIWQRHEKSMITGKIQYIGNQNIILNDTRIPVYDISKIKFINFKRQRTISNNVGITGIILSTAGLLFFPPADLILVPATVVSFVYKSRTYKINKWKLSTVTYDQSDVITKYKWSRYPAKYLILNHTDTLNKNTIFINPTKLLDNTISFSYEFNKNNKAKLGHEIEAGYFYPLIKIDSIASYIFKTIPNYYYHGFEASYTLKKYYYSIKNNIISLKYIGVNLLYKNMSFDNRWVFGHADSAYNYDSYMSQKKNIFGISLRNGMTVKKDDKTIEYYIGLGLKFAYNRATYYCYKTTLTNAIYNGAPPNNEKPFDDNGFHIYPYISFGIKYGFSW